MRWPLVVLLIAPLLVFWPFLFGGYTLTQNSLGLDNTRIYGHLAVVPLGDPDGSALSAEPYLVHLKRNLEHGHIPVLNMRNGLGSPGVESLVDGSFYPLNLVLLLLPTHKPFYFDLFLILHVYILLVGFYFLLRLYAPAFPAAAAAVLVALSGASYIFINLENYRGFVWIPWMMAGAVRIAREDRLRRSALLLVCATVACGTAGNVTEFATELGASVVVFVCEILVIQRRPLRYRYIFPATLGCALLIYAITILPFAASLRAGNLYVATGPDRAVRPYDVVWIFNWVLPKITGDYPYLFLHGKPFWPHADLSTTGFLFLLFGVLFGRMHKEKRFATAQLTVCLVVPIIMATGLVLILHHPFLDFLQYIPAVQDFFFIKYHLYLFGLAVIPIGIGLHQAMSLPEAERRQFIGRGFRYVVMIVLLIVTYLSTRADYSTLNVPAPLRMKLFAVNYGVSLGVFLLSAALLYWRPRHWDKILLGALVFQSMALLPVGYRGRVSEYPVTFEGGGNPGIDDKRLLIREMAESNLFFDAESIAMYGPIVNAHYREFLTSFFKVVVPWTQYQPTEEQFTATQVHALELLGVSGIFGYRVAVPDLVLPLPHGGYAVRDPLPRAFVISEETYRDFQPMPPLSAQSIEPVLTRIRADLKTMPQPDSVRVDGETVRLELKPNVRGILVLNQGYSTYWTFRGARPEVMLGLWPAWHLPGGISGDQALSYWPAGLTAGLIVSSTGLVLYILLDIFLLRKIDCATGTHSAHGGGGRQP